MANARHKDENGKDRACAQAQESSQSTYKAPHSAILRDVHVMQGLHEVEMTPQTIGPWPMSNAGHVHELAGLDIAPKCEMGMVRSKSIVF